MKLLIKQRVFSWTDSYDIYDESGNVNYYVKGEFFAFGHQLHVYDSTDNEIGMIKQKVFSFQPTFEIEIQGTTRGYIQKQFSLFHPAYKIDFNNWQAEGDFLGWEYDVYSGNRSIIHISKEFLHWGDTYIIDFLNPEHACMGMMLVIAIDAANCTQNS